MTESGSPLGRRDRIHAAALGWLWFLALRLQFATWRVRVTGLEELDDAIAERRPLLVVFWHGQYVPLFALLRGRKAAVLTNRSFRGEVIARISHHCGYSVSSLPDRGRAGALDHMREAVARFHAVGIALDGPLGPFHQIKRNCVRLAAEKKIEIFPVGVAASRKKVFTDRWDRMEVPRLWSRVAFVVGEPFEIAPDPGEDDMSREHIQRALERCNERAESLLRS